MDIRDKKGRFIKGRTTTAWNKGLKTPLDVRRKQSEAKLKNPTKYWLGKKRDKKTINAIREGRKRYDTPTGKEHHCWNGGTSGWWRRQAREVMSKRLGRLLKPTEIVHHIDGDYTNNCEENLVITNRSKHCKTHIKSIIAGRN